MAEYIEREEFLKKAIKERRFVFQMEDLLNNEVIFKTVYKDLSEFINSIPAADVAPVRHAKWEAVVGSDGKEYMVCTGCRKQQDLTGVFSYCPNCGCRMDGGDDE